MKRTKLVLAAAVLVVSGLALPGSASAAVHSTPTTTGKPIMPMLHPMHGSCDQMMNDL